MLRGLLLDYGGVMTTSVVGSFAAFCEAEGIPVGLFRDTVMSAARTPDSPFAKIEIGAISPEEFDGAVARLLSDACARSIEPGGLKQRMFAMVQPEPRMTDAVRAARRAGIKTALVSNSWGGRDYPFDDFAEMFDATVISGDVAMRKPNPDIYLHASEAVEVPAEECVFVDDFRVNVEGARAVGMTAILHRDPADTIPELERLFGVRLGADRPAGGR